MTYQVLARKWRPRNFREMAGQGHVLRTLVNALDNDRLHHAYLFTGTRGVGKTTIARILARCLNCEVGVSAEPCGECGACREIDEGRFIDLIEVDAASRTKVEDTRELLDNVQYAPSRGRYKVYLIDEVHMLSTSSFNALLKTLEEPPAHVKFLLATTDPQKLPVTVLSRCLQFNLKNLSPEQLTAHLRHILEQEDISFEEPALWQIAHGAKGSVRDSLTLLDQAIAYCGGTVSEREVSALLGTIDRAIIHRLVDALTAADAAELLAAVAGAADHAPDFGLILDDLLAYLHRVAVAQVVPGGVDNSQGDRDRVLAHARAMPAENVQLYYQIALKGRAELPLAVDPRAGLEMTLLRMLAFTPDGVPSSPTVPLGESHAAPAQPGTQDDPATLDRAKKKSADDPHERALKEAAPPTPRVTAPPPLEGEPWMEWASVQAEREPPAAKAKAAAVPPPLQSPPPPGPVAGAAGYEPAGPGPVGRPAPAPPPPQSPPPPNSPAASAAGFEPARSEPMGAPAPVPPPPQSPAVPSRAATAVGFEPARPGRVRTPPTDASSAVPPRAEADEVQEAPPTAAPPASSRPTLELDSLDPSQWIALFHALDLRGITKSIAANCVLKSVDGTRLTLVLDATQASVFNDEHRKRIQEAMATYFGRPLELAVEQGPIDAETPAEFRKRKEKERLREAIETFENDAVVREIVERFSGTIIGDSIEPLTPTQYETKDPTR